MTTPTSVHFLRVHPAQMRTRIRATGLAELAVQVKDGVDYNMPLLVRPNVDGSLTVMWGHRRWLALMISYLAYTGRSVFPVSAEEDLKLVEGVVKEYCTVRDGFVVLNEALYTKLQGLVPEDLTLPARVWDGSKENEILLLIKGNVGAEEPDLLGQAVAYKAALDAGVSLSILAQTVAMPETKLQAMVDLLDLPTIFQSLINDGLLNLDVVPELPGLRITAIKALAWALATRHKESVRRLKEQDVGLRDYTSRVRLAIVQLGVTPVVPDRKEVSPESYNSDSIIAGLYAKALEKTPARAYEVVATKSLEGDRLNSRRDLMDVLGEVPNLEGYFIKREDQWGNTLSFDLTQKALDEFMPGIDCSTCAFIELSVRRLRYELEIPCRQKVTGVASGSCISWTPKGARFTIRTPYYWDDGGKNVTTLKKLKAEWQAEWKRQQKKQKAEGAITSMADLRDAIQFYMDQHAQAPFQDDHPWATPCALCLHHLDKSPVKSAPDAPHCSWAKGRRSLLFQAYVPISLSEPGVVVEALTNLALGDEELVPFSKEMRCIVPSCLQFSPVEAWDKLIPKARTKPPYEREVLLAMILQMVKSINRNTYGTDSRGALQFLTGRPESSSSNHRDSFRSRFMKEKDGLDDARLWTLMRWLLLEWLRVMSYTNRQTIPVGTGRLTLEATIVQFQTAARLLDEQQK